MLSTIALMNQNFPYPKGSVWRKWDLQVQTILDDGYVSLGSYSEDLKVKDPTRWAQYVAKVGGEVNALLFDNRARFLNDKDSPDEQKCQEYVRNFFAFLEVFNPELECVGLTDHNYDHPYLLDAFFAYRSKCKVLGGVEINCNGIHILLFFPEKLYGKPTFSEGIHTFLAKFGIHNKKSGGSLSTTTCDIKELINEVEKNRGIVVYPHCNSSNGLFQERTATDRTLLAEIFNHQEVNLLQSKNKKSADAVEGYVRGKKELSSKFSTHIGSDARALKDIGQADEDGNFLWIKGDPSFEGLRQILYEPEQRIFVGRQKPGNKRSYFVIDSVRFIDNASGDFGGEAIEVNEDLTTIIGGKSTGKSLLLYYMAKAIDPKEVQERADACGTPLHYDFDASLDFNFEVTWKDGEKSLLREPEGVDPDSKRRKILYIPQHYLNTLSEANIKSRGTLNEFVLEVILQDPTIAEKYEATTREIRNASKTISIEVGQLFSEKEAISEIEEDLRQTGDEKGILSYLQSLQTEAETIKASSGLNEAELKTYERLVIQEKEIDSQLSNLEEDRKTVKQAHSSMSHWIGACTNEMRECEGYLNDEEVKKSFSGEMKLLENFEPTVNAAIQKVLGVVQGKEKALKESQVKIRAELAPLLAKVKLQVELQEKMTAIKKEQQKLNELAIKKNNLKNRRSAYNKKAEVILGLYKQLMARYEELRNEFKKYEDQFGEITLNVLVAFNSEAFNATIVREYLNRHDLKKALPDTPWDEEFSYEYDPQNHTGTVSTIFEGLLGETIAPIKGRTVKDAMLKLLENHFYLDFRIFYKNDPLDKMSPGKKGLVLLQLLIDLSNEEWPILLDQPEDDLDNRSVYDDLVAFLKKKKTQRQIIIVTHNPNLVVGADAEETIVANQSGQEIGRDNKKHRFEYVSSGLENSFELPREKEPAILYRKGIKEHVCEILEGGREAFQKRERKYKTRER